MKTINVRLLAVSLLAVMLAGCVTGGNTRSPTLDQYVGMSPAEQNAEDKKLDKLIVVKVRHDGNQEKRLWNGLPVHYEIDGMKITKRWDPQMGTLSFYEGYRSGTFGHDSLAALVLLTEHTNPTPIRAVDRRTNKLGYSVLVANVSVDSTIARALTKQLGGVLPASMNGYFAARVAADSVCKNCNSGTQILNQTSSQAQSVTDTVVDVSACTTNCLPVPGS